MKTIEEVINYLESEMKKNIDLINGGIIRKYQSNDDEFKEWCDKLINECITKHFELKKVLEFIQG